MLERGLVAFYDVESLTAGDRVQEVIAEAIELSPFFLVILSHHFKGKRYPEAEAQAALAFDKHTKKIIPLFYDMTADECCDSTNDVCSLLSSYSGVERKEKEDAQFASDVADLMIKMASDQLSSSITLHDSMQ